MANLSNASGKCTLRTKEIETMKVLIRAFKTLEDAEYSTCIGDDDFESNIKFNGNEYILNFDFAGVGRWTYDSNIEYFCSWTEDDLSEMDLKTLTENEWNISYDYMDEEGGQDFMYEATASLVHEKGIPYIETKKIDGTYISYKRNAINFIKLGFYDDLNTFIENEIYDTYDIEEEDENNMALEKIGDIDELISYYECENIDELRNKSEAFDEVLTYALLD